MKNFKVPFGDLRNMVNKAADRLKRSAEYSGALDDGGRERLLFRFSDVEQTLIVKYDLRPSEYERLNDILIDTQNELPDYVFSVIEPFIEEWSSNINDDITLFCKWFQKNVDGGMLLNLYASFEDETGINIRKSLKLCEK